MGGRGRGCGGVRGRGLCESSYERPVDSPTYLTPLNPTPYPNMKSIQSIILALTLLFLQTCSLPEMQAPEWEKEPSAVIQDIQQQLGTYETASVRWSASDENSSIRHILYVELTNGPQSSAPSAQLRETGKEALRIVLNSIANEEAYDEYRVVFKSNSSAGLVNVSSEESFEYELDELQ